MNAEVDNNYNVSIYQENTSIMYLSALFDCKLDNIYLKNSDKLIMQNAHIFYNS